MPQLLSLGSRAQELQLLSPRATSTEARVPWSLCATTREATMQNLHATTREQPPLTATREEPMRQQRPSTAKINKVILKKQTKLPNVLQIEGGQVNFLTFLLHKKAGVKSQMQ